MVNIGILTSSRADFGVYLPLLKVLRADPDFHFDLIVFGTHLSKLHGYTVKDIEDCGFNAAYTLTTVLSNDSEEAVSTSASLTSIKFTEFWRQNAKKYSLVLCLGDRYEMFSAVIAGVPFGINFVHFYGGDYSKGAIDNVYRDGMTICSKLHFTSTRQCANRVKSICSDYFSVDHVGIISLQDYLSMELLSDEMFKEKWSIDLTIPSVLITFHPETIHPERNVTFANIVYEVLLDMLEDYQIIITMPNADTFGMVFRDAYWRLREVSPNRVKLIENFGIESYFKCMSKVKFMIGNTSSGISESASFGKYFINIGDRQVGRQFGENIISVPFKREEILSASKVVEHLGKYEGENIYFKENSLHIIINRLKEYGNKVI